MIDNVTTQTLLEEMDHQIYSLIQLKRDDNQDCDYLLASFEKDAISAIHYFILNENFFYSDFDTFDHISTALHNTWNAMEDDNAKNDFNTIISSKYILEEINDLFNCRLESPL